MRNFCVILRQAFFVVTEVWIKAVHHKFLRIHVTQPPVNPKKEHPLDLRGKSFSKWSRACTYRFSVSAMLWFEPRGKIKLDQCTLYFNLYDNKITPARTAVYVRLWAKGWDSTAQILSLDKVFQFYPMTT